MLAATKLKMTQKWKQIFNIFLLFTININIKVIHCQEAAGNCSCGNSTLRKNTGRIFMGAEALYGEFPWHVGFLVYNGSMGPVVPEYFCGGSIINEFYILTAAHCFFAADSTTGQINRDFRGRKITITAGGRFVYRTAEMPQEERSTYKWRAIQELRLHPNYNPSSYHFDVAVAKLAQTLLPFDFQTQPICLAPNDGSMYENTDAIFSGFGSVRATGLIFTNRLHKTELNIQPDQYCVPLHQQNFFNRETMLCAYNPERNGCQGDSGSPLVILVGNLVYSQVGIFSAGAPCRAELIYCFPRYFIRVSYFLDWIISIAGNTQRCQP